MKKIGYQRGRRSYCRPLLTSSPTRILVWMLSLLLLMALLVWLLVDGQRVVVATIWHYRVKVEEDAQYDTGMADGGTGSPLSLRSGDGGGALEQGLPGSVKAREVQNGGGGGEGRVAVEVEKSSGEDEAAMGDGGTGKIGVADPEVGLGMSLLKEHLMDTRDAEAKGSGSKFEEGQQGDGEEGAVMLKRDGGGALFEGEVEEVVQDREMSKTDGEEFLKEDREMPKTDGEEVLKEGESRHGPAEKDGNMGGALEERVESEGEVEEERGGTWQEEMDTQGKGEEARESEGVSAKKKDREQGTGYLGVDEEGLKADPKSRDQSQEKSADEDLSLESPAGGEQSQERATAEDDESQESSASEDQSQESLAVVGERSRETSLTDDQSQESSVVESQSKESSLAEEKKEGFAEEVEGQGQGHGQAHDGQDDSAYGEQAEDVEKTEGEALITGPDNKGRTPAGAEDKDEDEDRNQKSAEGEKRSFSRMDERGESHRTEGEMFSGYATQRNESQEGEARKEDAARDQGEGQRAKEGEGVGQVRRESQERDETHESEAKDERNSRQEVRTEDTRAEDGGDERLGTQRGLDETSERSSKQGVRTQSTRVEDGEEGSGAQRELDETSERDEASGSRGTKEGKAGQDLTKGGSSKGNTGRRTVRMEDQDPAAGHPRRRERGSSAKKAQTRGTRGGAAADEERRATEERRERREKRRQREAGKVGLGSSKACPLGWFYVYDLDPRFNTQVLEVVKVHFESELNSSAMLLHHGMGEAVLESAFEKDKKNLRSVIPDPSSWFNTQTLMIEPLYHARLMQEKCRTTDPEKASAFYIPYYAALSIEKVISINNITLTDEIPLAFLDWLRDQPYFRRHGGHDHFIALGRGVWRFLYRDKKDENWGSTLLMQPLMTNVTKLVYDRDPWERTTFGIPYNVFFHPSTDAQIREWQEHVRTFPRRELVSFVGSTQRGLGFRWSSPQFQFRRELAQECQEWEKCAFFDCTFSGFETEWPCAHVSNIMVQHLSAEFCLQPPGDTWPRKSIFDSLVAGCIPVFFHNGSAYLQYLSYLPHDYRSFSVFIDMTVPEQRANMRQILESIPHKQIKNMRDVIIDTILPNIIVANPEDNRLHKFEDAVSVALKGILVKVARRRARIEDRYPNPWMWTNTPEISYQILHEVPGYNA